MIANKMLLLVVLIVLGIVAKQSTADCNVYGCPTNEGYVCDGSVCCPGNEPVMCQQGSFCCPSGYYCCYSGGWEGCTPDGQACGNSNSMYGAHLLKAISSEKETKAAETNYKNLRRGLQSVPSEGTIVASLDFGPSNETYEKGGIPYGICVCTSSSCSLYQFLSETSTDFRFAHIVYNTTCESNVLFNSTIVIPYAPTSVPESCVKGQISLIKSFSLSSLNYYSSLPAGLLVRQYSSADYCNNDDWIAWQWLAQANCGSFNYCYGNTSVYTPVNSDTIQSITYSSESCSTAIEIATVTTPEPCIFDPYIGLYVEVSTTAAPSSSSSNGTIQLSTAAYGVLIFFVFFAVCCGATSMWLYFKRSQGEKTDNKSLLNNAM